MATMTRIDTVQAITFWLDTPFYRDYGPRKSSDDWGNPASAGLCLKRRGIDLFADTPEAESGFAIYLGVHDGRHVVAIKDLFYRGLTGGEVFDDLAEMKRRWMLD